MRSPPRSPSRDASLIEGSVPGRRWTAADHVHEILERMVIGGVLKPGDRLTELSLAARLRVSRTPLRQALQRLVSKGWIERSTSGAIFVVDVSEQEIEALYAVRSALEEMMLVQASQRIGSPEMEALRELVSAQERAARKTDADEVSRYGEEFHRALWRMSGNQVGAQFLEDVLQRTTRYRRLSFAQPNRFRQGMKQHSLLVDALDDGNLEKARRLIRAHVDESRNYVLQAFRSWRSQEQPAPGTKRPQQAKTRKRS